jgi:hypothetical protein
MPAKNLLPPQNDGKKATVLKLRAQQKELTRELSSKKSKKPDSSNPDLTTS